MDTEEAGFTPYGTPFGTPMKDEEMTETRTPLSQEEVVKKLRFLQQQLKCQGFVSSHVQSKTCT